MSENKWTPGSWRKSSKTKAVISDSARGIDVKGATGTEASAYYGGNLICESVSDYNANLIAAAPELYDALEYARSLIMESLETGLSPKGIFAVNGGKGLAPIDNALAKARGESCE